MKKLLQNNGVWSFTQYKENIVDIDVKRIIDSEKSDIPYAAGYRYCNRLYDIIHKETPFILEKEELEYEIVEEGYPEDIPYANCEFDNVEEFHKWMLESGKIERELDDD